MIFDNLSMVAAVLLLYFAHNKYISVAFLVAIEFILHRFVYAIGVEYTDLLNNAWIFIAYMAIQTVVLWGLYEVKSSFTIAFLIFANLLYNFFTVLQYVGISQINFYGNYQQVVGLIMILELLYLIGVSRFVVNKRNRNGKLNHNNSDHLLRVRSWLSNRGLQ